MALLGLGMGPTFSGLQIAIQRAVDPAGMGAAMGTLMLLRQVGASIALAAAATLYAGSLHGATGQAHAATATGYAVFVVTIAGAAIAALALLTLPPGARRLAPATAATAGEAVA
jgi:hypothetical protein